MTSLPLNVVLHSQKYFTATVPNSSWTIQCQFKPCWTYPDEPAVNLTVSHDQTVVEERDVPVGSDDGLLYELTTDNNPLNEFMATEQNYPTYEFTFANVNYIVTLLNANNLNILARPAVDSITLVHSHSTNGTENSPAFTLHLDYSPVQGANNDTPQTNVKHLHSVVFYQGDEHIWSGEVDCASELTPYNLAATLLSQGANPFDARVNVNFSVYELTDGDDVEIMEGSLTPEFIKRMSSAAADMRDMGVF